jgi:hypothetical protein
MNKVISAQAVATSCSVKVFFSSTEQLTTKRNKKKNAVKDFQNFDPAVKQWDGSLNFINLMFFITIIHSIGKLQ